MAQFINSTYNITMTDIFVFDWAGWLNLSIVHIMAQFINRTYDITITMTDIESVLIRLAGSIYQ